MMKKHVDHWPAIRILCLSQNQRSEKQENKQMTSKSVRQANFSSIPDASCKNVEEPVARRRPQQLFLWGAVLGIRI